MREHLKIIQMNNKKPLTAKKLNRIIFVIMSILAVLILIMSVYFVFSLDKKSRELAKSRYILSSNNKKIESLAKLQEQYKRMGYLEERVGKYLPDNKDVTRLLKDIENMAGKHSLDFSLYQASGAKNKKAVASINGIEDVQIEKVNDYYALPIQLEIIGDFEKVNSLMEDLEKYDRLVQIQSVKYEKVINPKDLKTGKVKASFKLSVYLKK